MNREELLKNAKPILFNTEMVQAILEGRKSVTRRAVKPQPRLQNPLELKCDGFEQRKHEKGTNKWNEVQHNYLGEKFYSYGRTAPYKAGDILYVRETWQRNYCNDAMVPGKYTYKASPETWQYFSEEEKNLKKKWKPSIHMPKEAARIFLKVTDVRVERVKNITWEQTLAEGIEHDNVNKQEDILCEYCPIEESQRGVKNYGNGPSFCIDTGMCEKAKLNFEDDCVDCFSELWDSTFSKYQLCRYGWEANPFCWVIDFERVEVEND